MFEFFTTGLCNANLRQKFPGNEMAIIVWWNLLIINITDVSHANLYWGHSFISVLLCVYVWVGVALRVLCWRGIHANLFLCKQEETISP